MISAMNRNEAQSLPSGEGEYLYKYLSLNRKGSAGGSAFNRTGDIFRNQQMWMATLQSFNDPFEGRVHMSFEATNAQKLANARDHYAKSGVIYSDHELHLKIRELELKYTSQPEWVSKTFGVLSLTANPQSILMWSHYANSHCGICIQLKSVAYETKDLVGMALPVQYDETIPHMNWYTNGSLERATASILTKAQDWKYECEYRIVRNTPGYISIPSGQIAGVIFGQRMSDEDKQEVSQWVNLLDHPVAMYAAIMNENTYSMNIVSV